LSSFDEASKRLAVILNFRLSQGSVATQLTWCGNVLKTTRIDLYIQLVYGVILGLVVLCSLVLLPSQQTKIDIGM